MKNIALMVLFCTVFVLAQHNQTLSPEDALMRLMEGNEDWIENRMKFQHQDENIRHKTAVEGQHPFATILTCSDSRVAPELVFDQGVGDLFVIRVAGNVVGTDEVASIEYGVDHLGTPLLVVLGHTKCGAVTAAYKSWKYGDKEDHTSIPKLLHKIQPAIEKAHNEHPDYGELSTINAAVNLNVSMVIDRVLSLSEDTKKLVDAGKLKIVGGVYDIYHGNIHWILSPEMALNLLKKRNLHWSENHMKHPHHFLELRHLQATEGQFPLYTVLTCSDSRVIPEIIFDAGSGEIFVIRVAGNVIDDDEVASIEYGVEHLHTPVLLVLGHTNCGAVTAAVDHFQHPEHPTHGNIPKLVEKIVPAVADASQNMEKDSTRATLIAKSIKINVKKTRDKIVQNSERVRELLKEKKLKVVTAIYDIDTGKIQWFED